MDLKEYLEGKTVVIPKLQREYVQGTDVRGEYFIKRIFETLRREEDSPMVLDLVSDVIRDDGKVQPIDGQQRLTTLFLVYYYLGSKGNENIDFLKNFTYETRDSSTKFCKVLTDKKDDYIDAIKKQCDGERCPSEVIRSLSAYRVEYDYDYTVGSMLNMLDRIHNEYMGTSADLRSELFGRLGRIQFDEFDFGKYALGDELYVIMNDRGKPLSTFENFKSSLVEWMRIPEGRDEAVRDFIINLDTVWSDFVWEKLNDLTETVTDSVLYKIFCRYFYELCLENKEELTKEGKKKDYVALTDYFYNESEEEYYFGKFESVIDGINLKPKKLCDDLGPYFDRMRRIKPGSDEDRFGVPAWADSGDYIQDRFVKEEVSLVDRFLLYAYRLFADDHSPRKHLSDWKRFVWNYCEAVDLSRDKKTLIAAVDCFSKYRSHTHLINQYLEKKVLYNEASTDIEKCEARKAYWIIKDNSFYTYIKEAENHPFLKGDIDWLIKDTKAADTPDAFKNRYDVAKQVIFDDNGISKDNDDLVIRALLTKTEIDMSAKDSERGTSITLMIEESDDAKRVMKTQMHDLWDEGLRGYIDSIGPGSDAAENLVAKMEKDISDTDNYTDWGDNQIWHEELCKNKDVFSWIEDKMDPDGKKQRQRLSAGHLHTKRFRLDIKPESTNGPKIVSDENIESVLDEIKNSTVIDSSILDFKPVGGRNLFYFPYTNFVLNFKDGKGNDIKDNDKTRGFMIRPSTGGFESLRGAKWKIDQVKKYIKDTTGSSDT